MRIAFYPAQSGKSWNGDTLLTEPLGGSETAVVYVAQELARLGHEVIVFTRAEPGMYSDVLYIPFEEARAILRTLPLDVLICSRDAMPLIWTTQAQKRILWLHDLPQGHMPEADAYVCVSNWQAGVYVGNKFLPQERTRVIHNGIDPDLFSSMAIISDKEREETIQIAWTSNPERGLWHAAELVQRVRREYPNTELHVYGRNAVYGWSGSGEHNFYPHDMTGVLLRRAMSKAHLAEHLGLMDLWVYPTWWPETYCIAAVEAQAAGVPVVTSNFAALGETCATQVLVPGSMRDGPEHLDAMTDEVLKLIASEFRRKKLAIAGRAFAFSETWSEQAKRWDTLIRQ